jgi:formylglycine-generating enzyme required for sulfatase activity
MRLVTAEGARTRRTEEELVVGDPAARAALDALVRGRLLAAREVEGGTAYEVAHDALLTGWSTLREWLDAQAESRAVRQRLEAAAAEWERLGRTREELWSARQLAEAASIRKDELQPRELEFLQASRRAVRLQKLARNALIVSIPLLIGLVYATLEFKARRNLDRKIASHVTEAKIAVAQARIMADDMEKLRADAIARFDARDRTAGNDLWSLAIAQEAETEQSYARAAQALESALVLDGSRKEVRDLLGDILYQRALLAEQGFRRTQQNELLQRLALYDEDGTRMSRWKAPAVVSIATSPVPANVTVERVIEDHGRMRNEVVKEVGQTPVTELSLEPGSYVLVLSAAGRVAVRYPFLVARGERFSADIHLPRTSEIPRGFVYVPAGRFLFGTSDESLRRGFLNTVPVHPMTTQAYLIASTETTYGEWIDFLNALPAETRAANAPKVGGLRGSVQLTEVAGGQWQLTIQPTTQAYTARTDEPITYRARQERASQSWYKLPVSGISLVEAEAYTAWLNSSGRVPGARLCTELEWERAARGADNREYPHGNRLDRSDANFELTYGKEPLAFGPDEVSSHSASRSPFLVDDMAGNVYEFTRSTMAEGELVARGGSFYFDETTSRSTNRSSVEPTLRDIVVGMRVCATYTVR